MLKFDVPFVPDGDFPSFLADRQERLGCVHFSMYDSALSDARQLMEPKAQSDIISGLKRLKATPRYVLMNGRLHAPDTYFSSAALDATGKRLVALVEAGVISGIIFADFYYLQALSDAHPDLAAQLEAVPSINAMLSSAERVFSAFEMIRQTEFKLPSKLVLDRSLNRDMQRLDATVFRLRDNLPNVELYLMANEGCLYECPYKAAHDAHIALVNEGLCGERTFAMNRDLGCVRRMLDAPSTMLTSPFIRPEDAAQYEDMIDGIKLCGRNRGTDFLTRVITAYADEEYDGNLLDLMDAMGDMADRFDIPNKNIPDAFLEHVTTCTKHCLKCGRCAALAEEIITQSEVKLPTFS